jgi:PAS domain S-box-containing protein
MKSAYEQSPAARPNRATLVLRKCVRSVRSFAATIMTNSLVRRDGVPRHGWVFCVVLALLTLFGGTFGLWDMYRRTVDDLRSEVRDLGVIVGEQASSYVQVIDLLLQETQLRCRDLDIRTPDEFRRVMRDTTTHRFLSEHMKNVHHASAAALFDVDGMSLNTSSGMTAPSYSIADRGYFQRAREQTNAGLIVSRPLATLDNVVPSIVFARRITSQDGTFLGVVIVSVDVQFLFDLYRDISRERHIAVTLLRDDGTVLARYPATQVVSLMPSDSPWWAAVAAGGGSYDSPGYLTRVKVIAAVHPLHDYPLIIDTSIKDDDILAMWLHQAAYTVGAVFLLEGAIFVLFAVLSRQLQWHEEHNATLSRTATELRASESRLRDFAELASDWFWEQDEDLRFKEVIVGSPMRTSNDRSHIGKRRWEINDTSIAPSAWEQHKQQVLAHLRFDNFRFDRVGFDGALHHVSVSGLPLHDASGVFAGYRGIGRDVTAEVAASQELYAAKVRAEQAESLLRDAVDSMSEGFVIYDSDDRFVLCNEAYRRLYQGCASLMLPGVPYGDLVRNKLDAGQYPDAAGQEEKWFSSFMRIHLAADTEVETRLPGGKWILISERRMRGGGIAGLRIDITARKRAQAELNESEARLDRAQAIACVGSWELNLTTQRYHWSKELYRIRGVSPTDFVPDSDNVEPLVHPDDYPSVQLWISELTAGRNQDAREVKVIRPDGKVRLLRMEGRAMTDPDGVVRQLAGTMQDITDIRLIEQQLGQAQKMEAIGNLTGGMAHDFNNGLAVIIGNLDLLGRVVKTDRIAKELCDEARDGALRCADLIRLLLAFARRQPLQPRQIDVNELAKRTARLLERTLGEDITVTVHLGKLVAPVLADPAQLEAALTNLANNARDAMPRGGRLDITTAMSKIDAHYTALHPEVGLGDYVLIEVSDTGSGIVPEVIGNIFEPFFTTKGQGRGSGLGLSMVFGFVKQSGGHLTVSSEPGRGSTFRIYLPLALTDVTGTGSPGRDPLVVGGDETVLLVEDNAPLRRVTARQLAELGYRVREAADAEAALAVLSAGDRVDLLFTDVVMPGTMDGLDLAIDASSQRSDIKVLLTSGFPGVHGADQRITLCPFRLLGKPYSHAELARMLREVLDAEDGPSPVATVIPSSRAIKNINDGNRAVATEQV